MGINLLGVKQLAVGVNKMDSDVAGYKKSRYVDIVNETKDMLRKVGWKKDFVDDCVPMLPMSGWIGDNLLTKSKKMTWWEGKDVKVDKNKVHYDTLLDVLESVFKHPPRKADGS